MKRFATLMLVCVLSALMVQSCVITENGSNRDESSMKSYALKLNDESLQRSVNLMCEVMNLDSDIKNGMPTLRFDILGVGKYVNYERGIMINTKGKSIFDEGAEWTGYIDEGTADFVIKHLGNNVWDMTLSSIRLEFKSSIYDFHASDTVSYQYMIDIYGKMSDNSGYSSSVDGKGIGVYVTGRPALEGRLDISYIRYSEVLDKMSLVFYPSMIEPLFYWHKD